MLAASDISRSLSRMTVNLHRQIETKRNADQHYRMRERDQQYQHAFSGKLGPHPVEATFKILFDILFVGDAAMARDSQFDTPQVRFGFEMTSAPDGTVPYAHVVEWIRDDSFNFTGCKVRVGVHNPRLGQGAVARLPYKGVIHCSFQGYGAPIDPDGPDPGGTDSGKVTGGELVAHTAEGGTVSTAVTKPPQRQPVYPLPTYPAGPLGGTGFTTVASWNPHDPLSDFTVPKGEARLKVSSDDGRLTTADPYEVFVYGKPNPPSAPSSLPPDKGPWNVPAGHDLWYRGDKYAAQWTAPGKTGNFHKVRAHLLLNPTGNDYLMQRHSIVVNMEDRQHGLGFFFDRSLGIGWTEDLRPLGVVQGVAGDFSHGQQQILGSLIMSSDSSQWAMQQSAHWSQQYWTEHAVEQAINESQARATSEFCATMSSLKEVWVEVWRHGDNAFAGIFTQAPGPGVKPVYMSQHLVKGSKRYDKNVPGYFGWTTSYITPGGAPGTYDGASWPFGYPKRGVLSMTLFKES